MPCSPPPGGGDPAPAPTDDRNCYPIAREGVGFMQTGGSEQPTTQTRPVLGYPSGAGTRQLGEDCWRGTNRARDIKGSKRSDGIAGRTSVPLSLLRFRQEVPGETRHFQCLA